MFHHIHTRHFTTHMCVLVYHNFDTSIPLVVDTIPPHLFLTFVHIVLSYYLPLSTTTGLERSSRFSHFKKYSLFKLYNKIIVWIIYSLVYWQFVNIFIHYLPTCWVHPWGGYIGIKTSSIQFLFFAWPGLVEIELEHGQWRHRASYGIIYTIRDLPCATWVSLEKTR